MRHPPREAWTLARVLDALLMKMGRTACWLSHAVSRRAGKSGDPRSQNADTILEPWGRGSECTRRNNMEVQLSEFFNKRGLNFVNLEVGAVRLAAQGINHYISLGWCIGNTKSKSATISIHLC